MAWAFLLYLGCVALLIGGTLAITYWAATNITYCHWPYIAMFPVHKCIQQLASEIIEHPDEFVADQFYLRGRGYTIWIANEAYALKIDDSPYGRLYTNPAEQRVVCDAYLAWQEKMVERAQAENADGEPL